MERKSPYSLHKQRLFHNERVSRRNDVHHLLHVLLQSIKALEQNSLTARKSAAGKLGKSSDSESGFAKDMFLHANVVGFQKVSHYLFRMLDERKCEKHFGSCWPVLDRTQEVLYKQGALEWIQQIAQENPQFCFPNITPGVFVASGGTPVAAALAKLATYVLHTLLLHIPQNNSGSKVLCYPSISKALRQSYPGLAQQTIEMHGTIVNETYESVKKAHAVSVILESKFKEMAGEQVREFRKNYQTYKELQLDAVHGMKLLQSMSVKVDVSNLLEATKGQNLENLHSSLNKENAALFQNFSEIEEKASIGANCRRYGDVYCKSSLVSHQMKFADLKEKTFSGWLDNMEMLLTIITSSRKVFSLHSDEAVLNLPKGSQKMEEFICQLEKTVEQFKDNSELKIQAVESEPAAADNSIISKFGLPKRPDVSKEVNMLNEAFEKLSTIVQTEEINYADIYLQVTDNQSPVTKLPMDKSSGLSSLDTTKIPIEADLLNTLNTSLDIFKESSSILIDDSDL